jgi:hypothetical protein
VRSKKGGSLPQGHRQRNEEKRLTEPLASKRVQSSLHLIRIRSLGERCHELIVNEHFGSIVDVCDDVEMSLSVSSDWVRREEAKEHELHNEDEQKTEKRGRTSDV